MKLKKIHQIFETLTLIKGLIIGPLQSKVELSFCACVPIDVLYLKVCGDFYVSCGLGRVFLDGFHQLIMCKNSKLFFHNCLG